MKVLDLRCSHDHGFEGWFASEDDFLDQTRRGLVECPLCGDKSIMRLPSAPRLNLGHAGAPVATEPPAAPPATAVMQGMWVEAIKHVLARTEDVGDRFPEEARRIHYGESEARGIRGQATEAQREALSEEGIEVVALPIPAALKGPTH
ncbi:MAG: DUF1178 family protein [Vitreoscilla sp.]|nr:DUF1178 family protein [Vitreoscilla sp.]